jgi:arylsulfatase A-like enzyme
MPDKQLRRRDFLATAGVLAGAALGVPGIAAAQRPPNIVILLSDDQGWGDLSIHGNLNINTPHIDSLARDGALFDRFYVCPVCAPTRAEFLTGRYYPRTGVHGVSTGQERMNPDEITLAHTLKAAGYATGAFGKWHNGSQWPYHPNARGFDEYYGFTSGHWGHYFDPILEHNGELVRGRGFIADDFTNKALAFIERNKDKPFLCYIPFCTPHSPMQVPDPYWERHKENPLYMRNRDRDQEEEDKTRAALAMCENIDDNMGRVLAKLDDLKLADNTIVIYFSDNGPNSFRWNEGMKGRKGSPDEGGLRVPFLIRWPGHIPPGTRIPQIAGAIDLLPTLADLAGVPLISEKPLDGISIKPLLFGTAGDWPNRMLLTYRNRAATVRSQQYRLDPTGQLFDIARDPGQYRNIAADHPELVAKMQAAAEKFLEEVRSVEDDDRPFTVGYPEFPTTYLPARDAKTQGTIQRSAGAPNCSFFTHWTSTDDRITWDIEVANSGVYQAIVYYTCPDKDTGARIELAFQSARFEGRVNEGFDPPLVGETEDRVPRKGESFVKDWRPLDLGNVALEKGRGLLTLRATEIPGTQAMDVRGVVLKLIG